MARRIKEEPAVHQNRIAMKAIRLFSEKGIDNTSMDDIAKAAGYSKATLYVYFKNKDEIVEYIALKSMSELRDALINALENQRNAKEAFHSMCSALVKFQTEYPAFFDRVLQYISVDTNEENGSMLNQTYKIGEEINEAIAGYLESGEKKGELKPFDNKLEIILHVWGMISGIIKFANEKAEYIEKTGGISKETFLNNGFDRIYQIISI